jgi:uncharacterized protein involved in exopolysaccharide biosynthesis
MNINIVTSAQESKPNVRVPRKRRVWIYVLLGVLLPLITAVFALQVSQYRTLEFESEASLIVTFGEEYIARPLAGDSESWAPWSQQTSVNSELAILNSDTVRDRVIERVGIDQILARGSPQSDNFKVPGFISSLRSLVKPFALAYGLVDQVDDVEASRRAWNRNLNAKGVKETSVIYVSYRHPNAETAKQVVDAIVAVYFDVRRAIYAKPRDEYSTLELSLRRTQYEQALRDMGDFEPAKGGADFASIVTRQVEEVGSLEAVLAGLDRNIASQLAALATQEVGGASSGVNLSDAMRSNATIAGMRAERGVAEGQLAAAREQLQALRSKSADYAVVEERMDSAREAYRKALALSRQAEVEIALDESQFSNVKILQSGSLPRSPVNLSTSTLVALASGLALGVVIIMALLFAGRRRFPRETK